MKLSKRMTALANLVTIQGTIADVGCDHGFLPIYLVEENRVNAAIAMDVRTGPLQRAKDHIAEAGLEDKIDTRLSDGIEALKLGEADSILIAGMGGGIILHILQDGLEKAKAAGELILQPQSEIYEVRRFLAEHHFAIVAEDMVEEDGKYYPMMRVVYQKNLNENDEKAMVCKTALDETATDYISEKNGIQQEMFFTYGELLVKAHHPILEEYLKKELQVKEQIKEHLEKQRQNEAIVKRCDQVKKDTALIQYTLKEGFFNE